MKLADMSRLKMPTGGPTWNPGVTFSSLAVGRSVCGSPPRALPPLTSGVSTLIRQSRRDVVQHLLGEQLLKVGPSWSFPERKLNIQSSLFQWDYFTFTKRPLCQPDVFYS